jgi:hypothetical protein
MAHYRWYFTKGDHIVAAENIEAVDDAAALLTAEQMATSGKHSSIEIWQEKRIVARSTFRTDVAETGQPPLAAGAWSAGIPRSDRHRLQGRPERR